MIYSLSVSAIEVRFQIRDQGILVRLSLMALINVLVFLFRVWVMLSIRSSQVRIVNICGPYFWTA